jgi:hypothetical protein
MSLPLLAFARIASEHAPRAGNCMPAELHANAYVRGAFSLGFDYAGGFAVDVEQIVGEAKTLIEHKLADRHATRGVDVGLLEILNGPARCGEQGVDGLAGLFFRSAHVMPTKCASGTASMRSANG